MREKRDDTPDSPENFTLPYQKCLCNVCKIWLKQKFCLRAREGFFWFYFGWFCPGIDDTHETERRTAEEAPVSIRCPPLASQMAGSTDGLYDHYGLETHSMKSNLSSYRKKKKKVYECGFAPNTRQSESTMGTGRLPKSLLEQVPAARAGSPLPLGH